MTAQVIRFCDFAAPWSPRIVDLTREPASIIIMPVVRIERHPDKPSEGFDQPRLPPVDFVPTRHGRMSRRRRVPINTCGND